MQEGSEAEMAGQPGVWLVAADDCDDAVGPPVALIGGIFHLLVALL